MKDAIGGYFELELRKGEHYHKDAIRLNTARNCFEYILRARNYKKVYIPYYTCEVMLEPIHKLGIPYEFYHINYELEPEITPSIKANEAFLYTNYFGLKQACIEELSSIYGNQLIVDNAQAFYAKRIDGIDTFYSPRKFFGVPDGGYLYTDCKLDMEFPQDKSYERMHHLLIRIENGAESGYNMFKEAESSLGNRPIMHMSNITDRILRNIDYDSAIKVRRMNFAILHNKLSSSNLLCLNLDEETVPMVYPYLSDDPYLNNRLITNKIFVATYWPNVFDWCSENSTEYRITQGLTPLLLDQRYNCKHLISKYIKLFNV